MQMGKSLQLSSCGRCARFLRLDSVMLIKLVDTDSDDGWANRVALSYLQGFQTALSAYRPRQSAATSDKTETHAPRFLSLPNPFVLGHVSHSASVHREHPQRLQDRSIALGPVAVQLVQQYP